MRAILELAVLLAACLLVHFVGLADVSFYTRGEPREGLVVREMLATGHWLVPSRPEGELTRKPPLYYWLAAPVVRALPERPELAMRLPSAVLATMTALGTWAVARAVVGPTAALPAALILVTAFEWSRAATSARIDMTLAAPLTAVLAAWMLVLEGRSRRWLVVAAIGASAATLAKGPVGLVLPALTALLLAAVRRDWRVLRTLGVVPVLGLATVVAGAWYACAFFEQGWAFLDVVFKENVARFVDADDGGTGHAHGPLYLPLLGLVGMLPWTPLLSFLRPALAAPRKPALVLAGLWSITVLCFFSVANAKRSVYLLPLHPAIAILLAAGACSTTPGGAATAAARVYLPLLVLVATAATVLASGDGITLPLHGLLEPEDLHAANAVVTAFHHHHALVLGLGVATIALAVGVDRARRATAWRRLVLLVAVGFAAWTAAFQVTAHRAIARARGIDTFMRQVDRLVPAGVAIGHSEPTHPAVRFYAPRRLVRAGPRVGRSLHYVLLWETEVPRWRAAGRQLHVVAKSHTRPASQGRLVLVTIDGSQP